jgi:hypothetical protein
VRTLGGDALHTHRMVNVRTGPSPKVPTAERIETVVASRLALCVAVARDWTFADPHKAHTGGRGGVDIEIDGPTVYVNEVLSAYHEAGHAVSAWLWFGCPFTTITIQQDAEIPTLVGLTSFEELPRWYSPQWARHHRYDPRLWRLLQREGMVGWAGPLAEMLARGSTLAEQRTWSLARPDAPDGRDVFTDPEDEDVIYLWGIRGELWLEEQIARELLASLDEVAVYFERLRQETLDLMDRPEFWPAVQRLAQALLEGKRLTWSDARPLFEK